MKDIRYTTLESVYGAMPRTPDHLDVKIEADDTSFAAGRASLTEYILSCYVGECVYHFHTRGAIISGGEAHPVIIHIDYDKNLPSRYTPCEEIVDMGYSVISFAPTDILPEKKGDGGLLGIAGRKRCSIGRLIYYAYAAMRVVDMLWCDERVDRDKIYIAAHGELAEAALVACAYDTRICGVMISGDIGDVRECNYSTSYLGESEYIRLERLAEIISPRKIFASYAKDEMGKEEIAQIMDISNLVGRCRNGAPYLGRGEWQFMCREAKMALSPIPC